MRISTSLRVDAEARDVAAEVFKQYGMSMSDGVNLFLHQVALSHSIPFELKVPSAKMKEALQELSQRRGESFQTIEDLKADLLS